MKRLNCGEEILADDAKMCPYCFSKNLGSEVEEIITILKCPLCGSDMNSNEDASFPVIAFLSVAVPVIGPICR